MTVTLATFMEILDTSIANVALPHIAGNLSASADEATWVLTSYLVANAIVLPVSGWLASVIGRKRYYMICVALFTASSLACGLAPSLPWLIVFRVLQGVGGGGLQPSEQAILADTFPPARRGMAFAIYGMAVVLAPAIGPTLGGWLTDNTSWRWIFFINLPVGLVSLVLSARVVEDPPWARRRSIVAREVDLAGLGLIVVGLGALQIMLDKGEREDWFASRLIVVLAIASAVGLVAAVARELRHPNPIVDLTLFRVRNFSLAWLMMFALGAVLFGTTVILPLFLQTLLGYPATKAGEALSPGALLVIFMLPLVGVLVSRVDPRWLIGIGFATSALALWHMSGISLDIDFRTAVLYRVYQSAGMAFLFVPITTLAYVGVPIEKNNQVSALINLARNIGGSVGISLATLAIARRAQHHQAHLVAGLDPLDDTFRRTVATLTRAFASLGAGPVESLARAHAVVYQMVGRQAAALAYADLIWVLAILCAALISLVLIMRRGTPGAPPPMH